MSGSQDHDSQHSIVRKSDLTQKVEYDYPVYYLYAVFKASGVLHYAYAFDRDFDAEGILKDFGTPCGKDQRREFNPNWPDEWVVVPRTQKDIPYKRVCRTCSHKQQRRRNWR